ncbi:MAG TPA: hypothetical protein VF670_04085 [Duganella sp.]|jgi:hypothetical protein
MIPSEGELFKKILRAAGRPRAMAVVDTSGRPRRHRPLVPQRCGCAYNFTAPQSLSQARFSRVAASVLGRPYGFPTPGWPMRMALGEQADLLLEGRRLRVPLPGTRRRAAQPGVIQGQVLILAFDITK